MTLQAIFADGSSALIIPVGAPVPFQTAIATRGDGKKRVIFLQGAQLQQPDPWISRIASYEVVT